MTRHSKKLALLQSRLAAWKDSERPNSGAETEWVLYAPISRTEFLRVFPHGTSLDHRFPQIDAWLNGHYQPAADAPIRYAGYSLLVRKSVPGR